ncbi:MAG: hypothetical protein R2712_05065 [Vicinamibacterales bacterium]
MRPDPGAVLFDLDDTLYPHRQFVVSGLAAVSCFLDEHWGLEAAGVFRVLTRAMRHARGRELQAAAAAFDLPPWIIPQLVDVVRRHEPRLRLPQRVHSRHRGAPRWLADWRRDQRPARRAGAQGRGAGARGHGGHHGHRAVGSRLGQATTARRSSAAGCLPDADGVRRRQPGGRHRRRRAREHVTICLARVNRESWTSATGADAVVTSMSEVPSVAMGLIDGRRAYVV